MVQGYEEDSLDDIYKDGVAESLMDAEELTAEEEAFLLGYNSAYDYTPDLEV